MNEFENNNQHNDTLSGFDNTNDSTYNKRSEDIIQDEVTPTTPPPQHTAPQHQTPPTYTTPYNNFYQAPPPKQKKERRGHSTAVVIIAAVLAAVIGAVSGIAVMGRVFTTDTNITSTIDKTNKPQNNVNITVDETASSIA